MKFTDIHPSTALLVLEINHAWFPWSALTIPHSISNVVHKNQCTYCNLWQCGLKPNYWTLDAIVTFAYYVFLQLDNNGSLVNIIEAYQTYMTSCCIDDHNNIKMTWHYQRIAQRYCINHGVHHAVLLHHYVLLYIGMIQCNGNKPWSSVDPTPSSLNDVIVNDTELTHCRHG
jgi:hypothetical protein